MKKERRWIVFLGGFFLIPICFSTYPASGQETQEIRIGTAISLTGKEAKVGGLYKEGYEMAIVEKNEQGGIYLAEIKRKVPVKYIVYDDKSDAKTCVDLTEYLIKVDKVSALLGAFSTTIAYSQTVVPQKYGIPYVTGDAASTTIWNRGFKWIFGTSQSIQGLGEITADWLLFEQKRNKLPKPMKVILLWMNTAHGKDYQIGIQRKVKKHSDLLRVSMDESFEGYSKDFTPILLKAKAAQADVFLVDAYLPDYVLMHRQYTVMGLYHKVVSYGGRGPDESARTSLGKHSDYLISAQWWTKELPYPQVRKWVEKYEKIYKHPAELYAALGYEASRALLAAIEKAGSLSPDKIRETLSKIDLPNSILVGQRTYFPSETGNQINNPFVVVQNKPEKRTSIIYPPDAVTAEAAVPIPK